MLILVLQGCNGQNHLSTKLSVWPRPAIERQILKRIFVVHHRTNTTTKGRDCPTSQAMIANSYRCFTPRAQWSASSNLASQRPGPYCPAAMINRKVQAQVAPHFSTHLQRNPQPYTAWCRLKGPWSIVATRACHMRNAPGRLWVSMRTALNLPAF